MKVYGRCKHCKNEINYKTKANTRIQFAMFEGETISLKCDTCKNNIHFEVDDLYAQHSTAMQITAGLIFFFGTFFILYFVFQLYLRQTGVLNIVILSSALLIPFTIYDKINEHDQKRVRAFNRVKFK